MPSDPSRTSRLHKHLETIRPSPTEPQSTHLRKSGTGREIPGDHACGSVSENLEALLLGRNPR